MFLEFFIGGLFDCTIGLVCFTCQLQQFDNSREGQLRRHPNAKIKGNAKSCKRNSLSIFC